MNRRCFLGSVLFFVCWQWACSCPANEIKGSCPAVNPAIEPFLWRWDLTIHATDWQCPSWLEVSQDSGVLKAWFVGRWGNVRYLPRVEIEGEEILFVSPKDEEDSNNDLIFRGKSTGTSLVETAQGPNNVPWTWTGEKAPALKPAVVPQWGEPKPLFNGKDFTGWTFDNPAEASSWKVEKKTLVNTASGSNIVTTEKFGDFKLHIEVNCPKKANSGIYLRGRYEVQVEDDSIDEPPSHHMGAVYGFLSPVPEQPRRPGVWQSFDITLLGRFVTVVQNGKTIINNQEIPGITGGALDSHEELPGPIYLQGDHGGIAFRNILLTPAKP